jgi:adenine-specific DNA glycosylase
VSPRLGALLDILQSAGGGTEPLPATDGWLLVLRENIAYLVDDDVRDRCMVALEETVGLEPEAILAAPTETLAKVVAGMRPHDRVGRLRTCAELRLSEAPWKAYPGIGRPGVERIQLFTGERPVLALDSNAARVLYRLGYGDVGGRYDAMHRRIQAAAQAELPADIATLQRAHQLLRRHGKSVCTRTRPGCEECPLRARCEAGQGRRTLDDPFGAG